MSTLISPSLLAADKNDLVNEVKRLEKGGADWVHFDVMDGVFVENISFSLEVFNNFCKTHHLVNDVHLMVVDPKELCESYAKTKCAHYITFHFEACENNEEILSIIDIIHRNGSKAGVSVKPGTDVKKLDFLLPFVDLILIMSVEPGKGGQKFMSKSLEKISYLSNKKNTNGFNFLIEVDGGINNETAVLCKNAGVDVLVAGSYVFKDGASKIKERIDSLK